MNEGVTKHLLATKLYIPSTRLGLVSRPRLVERLHRSLGCKLTLISAPAGFGKTTLIADFGKRIAESPNQYSAFQNPQLCWLSLDEGDGDLIRFLTYLIAALQNVVADIGSDTLGMLQSPQTPAAETLLTALINEIAIAPQHIILVLDDYHLVDAKPIDDALTFLLERLPPNLHLALTTREDPPLPLARLRARRQLTEIRAADLRFTLEETAVFLNQIMGLNLSAADIAALETRTEGWIAGLQLAALSLQGEPDAHSFVRSFTGTHRFVLDYLLEEVLQKQPASTQAFLLPTSILNRLCAPLCDALLPETTITSQTILEELERSNLFINALDNERHWYRYHHLFGDLLRQRLGQNLPPAEIAIYHIRASAWYEKNGELSESFHHAIAAEDFHRAANLAEMAWQGMDEALQAAAWLAWITQLPEDAIRVRPVLCTQIAWSFTDTGQTEASEARLQDAERCLAGSADDMIVVEEKQFRALPARIAFARAYNSLITGPPAATVQYAEEALTLVPQDEPFLQAQINSVLGSVYWSSGKLDAAAQSMREWVENAEKAGNIIFAIATGFALADILVAQGRLREAKRTIQQSLQLAAEHVQARSVIANHHIGLAMIAHEMGDDAAAAAHFAEGVALAAQSTLVNTPYCVQIALAQFRESDGALAEALERLAEAQRVYVETPIPDTRPAAAMQARVYLKLGNLAKAQEWALERNLTVDDEAVYLREFELLTLARVLLAEYRENRDESLIDDALRLLARLWQAAEDDKRTASLIEILIMQALAYQAQGSASNALSSLERALTLAEPEGYVHLFLDEGTPMIALLKEVLQRQSSTSAYARRLLAVSPAAENNKPLDQPLLEPLSDRELDVLRLLATDLSGPEIARELMVSLSTVRTHTRNIYSKLGVNNRRTAVSHAKTLRLL